MSQSHNLLRTDAYRQYELQVRLEKFFASARTANSPGSYQEWEKAQNISLRREDVSKCIDLFKTIKHCDRLKDGQAIYPSFVRQFRIDAT
jgi:hypothetical protein